MSTPIAQSVVPWQPDGLGWIKRIYFLGANSHPFVNALYEPDEAAAFLANGGLDI